MKHAGWPIAVVLAALAGCTEERQPPVEPPTYEGDVQPILAARCVECHTGDDPSGGWRATSYLEVLGCTAKGDPVTRPASDRAPLLEVLERDDHSELLEADQRRVLSAWIHAITPKFRGTVHETGILDPRSDAWHGVLAAQDGWGPLSEPEHELNCGRCHADAPTHPESVTYPAPGATACSDCHDEPRGALDCATCHGGEGHAYPPRDACYFDPPLAAGAHAAHGDDIQVRESALACSSCHPSPKAGDLFAPPHANGTLDLGFDPGLAGEDATYDPDEETCAVACHARGGRLTAPTWAALDAALGCDDCHQSPPPEHYAGPCNICHAEMGIAPDSLTPGPLHVNGRVDLGDGSGTCGSCHGPNEAGWPADAVHTVHRTTEVTAAIDCDTCHPVPEDVDDDGHLDGTVQVHLSGRAQGPGLTPEYAQDTCSEVACHGALLATPAPDPTWGMPGSASGCLLCHGVPPAAPHTRDPGCSATLCHGTEVAEWPDGPRITESGRSLHIDGNVDTR